MPLAQLCWHCSAFLLLPLLCTCANWIKSKSLQCPDHRTEMRLSCKSPSIKECNLRRRQENWSMQQFNTQNMDMVILKCRVSLACCVVQHQHWTFWNPPPTFHSTTLCEFQGGITHLNSQRMFLSRRFAASTAFVSGVAFAAAMHHAPQHAPIAQLQARQRWPACERTHTMSH